MNQEIYDNAFLKQFNNQLVKKTHNQMQSMNILIYTSKRFIHFDSSTRTILSCHKEMEMTKYGNF
jgi:hypothetical protein